MRPRFAMLACAVAAVAVAVAPGVAGAAPRHNHGLTINATPNPIASGQGVLIYGQLTGTPVLGQTVFLYHRVGVDRHFSVIGHTSTDSFGFYKFTREEGVVTTNRSWFVRGPNGSHSRTITEQVSALVSITADKTTADTRQPVTFTGAVSPSHAGGRVLLQAQTGSSDDWHTLKTGRLDATSHYSIAYRWSVPGERDVRVVLPGDARNIRSASDAVTVTIQQAQVADFTIGTSQPIIPEGSTATISGVLYQPNSTTPEPHTSVSLWSRGPGESKFHKLVDTTTGTNGGYSFTQQPATDEVYQVRTTLPANRHTAALFEGVRDVITLAVSPATTPVGAKVLFSGSVTPDKARHHVALQRLGSDGDWHTVADQVVRASSTFQFTRAFGNSGTDRFRARIYSDARNIGAASNAVAVTVTSAVAPIGTLPPGP